MVGQGELEGRAWTGFAGGPQSSAGVPDEPEARLAVFDFIDPADLIGHWGYPAIVGFVVAGTAALPGVGARGGGLPRFAGRAAAHGPSSRGSTVARTTSRRRYGGTSRRRGASRARSAPKSAAVGAVTGAVRV